MIINLMYEKGLIKAEIFLYLCIDLIRVDADKISVQDENGTQMYINYIKRYNYEWNFGMNVDTHLII